MGDLIGLILGGILRIILQPILLALGMFKKVPPEDVEKQQREDFVRKTSKPTKLGYVIVWGGMAVLFLLAVGLSIIGFLFGN